MSEIVYKNDGVKLLLGNCLDVISEFPDCSIDMIFADPPYNLSNGGVTCQAGRMVSVNKGEWDKSKGFEQDHQFSVDWLNACRRVLKDDGTIWISGTSHSIYSVGFALQQIGYKILNEICWYKPNASPNLSCRYFTHSHEVVLWAAKSTNSRHKFNYEYMKQIAGGKQMRSVWMDIAQENTPQDIWTINTPTAEEKQFGKHPTQKPLALLERIILASTDPNDIVLDPFTGSSTTGVAAIRHNRRFIGIDLSKDFLDLSALRVNEELTRKNSVRRLIEEAV
jgi:site-specific DNA-methyltransferase (adenine-specific)